MPSEKVQRGQKYYYESYVGEFKDDKFEGNGKYQFVDGAIYEGKWQNNIKIGQGKLTLTGKF